LRDGALVRVGHGYRGSALRDGAFLAVGRGQSCGSLHTRRAASGYRLSYCRSRRCAAWAGADLRAARSDQDHVVIVSSRCLHQVTPRDRGCQRARGELCRPADDRAAGRFRWYGDWPVVALSMVNHCRSST